MEISPNIRHAILNSTIPLTLADARDTDNPILAANGAFCALTAYTMDAVVGRNCRFLQGNLDNADSRAEIREALESGRDIQVLLRNVSRIGDVFENLLFIYHIPDGKGDPLYYLGSQFKVSEYKVTSSLESHVSEMQRHARLMISEAQSLRQSHQRQMSDTTASLMRSKVLFEQIQ